MAAISVSVHAPFCAQLDRSFSLIEQLAKFRKVGEADVDVFEQDPILCQLRHICPIKADKPEFSSLGWIQHIHANGGKGLGMTEVAFRCLGIIFRMNIKTVTEHPTDRDERHQQVYFGTTSRLVRCAPKNYDDVEIFTAINRRLGRIASLTLNENQGMMLFERRVEENVVENRVCLLDKGSHGKYASTRENVYQFCREFLGLVHQDDQDAAAYRAALQLTPIVGVLHPIVLDCLGFNSHSSLHLQAAPTIVVPAAADATAVAGAAGAP